MMLPNYTKQFSESMEEKRRQLLPELEKMKDFYLEMQWDFTSWSEYASLFISLT